MYVPILTVFEQAAVDGLKEAADQTLELSNAKAPKDDLDLVNSGKVTVDDLTVQVSYDAVHARFQHENLDYEHADGGEAKFLETASDEVDVEAIAAASLRKKLG